MLKQQKTPVVYLNSTKFKMTPITWWPRRERSLGTVGSFKTITVNGNPTVMLDVPHDNVWCV